MIWMALLLAQAPADPAAVRGAEVFAKSCAVIYCHGPKGAAGRAPQLAGREFDRFTLLLTVSNGIPRTSMPAFNKLLKLEEIDAVVSYIMSLSAPAPAPSPAMVATAKRPPPPGIQRGRELFFDAARIASCGSCHELDGWGMAVGPDLMAASLKDTAALRAVRQTRVKTARPKAEPPFPALPVEQAKEEVSVYDLTGPLPVLRVFPAAEVTLADGATWSHAAATRIYPDSELASILAYLRWLTAR